MTKKQKTLAVVGGVALAAVVVGGVAYAYEKKKSTPAIPNGGTSPNTPILTPTSTLTQGGNYGFAAQLPQGITSPAALIAGLEGSGWRNVQVQFFGPSTNNGTLPPGLPFTVPAPIATAYVASGTWTGATGTPVGSGIVAAQIT
jgi:hypothetical protein